MLNWLRKHLSNRRSRAFMATEARRFMEALNIPTGKLSDKAIMSLTVSFGVAYLQSLVLAKELKAGTARLITDLMDGAKQERRLDG
jgi:hypothetical protein